MLIQIVIILQQEIEIIQMEKNFKNITNLTPKAQGDRIKQIQLKLQLIAQNKNSQLREQKVNNATSRVGAVEKATNQYLRKVEMQVKEQKQMLKQLTREYEENNSKHELSLKNRISQINQLQSRFTGLLKVQLQRARDQQKKIIFQYQQKIQSLRLELAKQIQIRKQYFAILDNQLSDKLPSLQNEVFSRMSDLTQNLNKIQLQIQNQTERVCRQIKEDQQKQVSSFEQLMKMIGSVITQIKQQICNQRQGREASRKKLVTLFQGAYSKLSN